MPLAALIALAIIGFAAGFHLHWALGGKRGFGVSLPQRADGEPVLSHLLPLWRPAALLVALGLLALGGLVAAKALSLDLRVDSNLIEWALLVTGAGFIARALVPNRYVGLFKSLRTTRWARYDTRLYSPLFLILGVSLIAVAGS